MTEIFELRPIVVANWLLCSGIGFVCYCRIRAMSWRSRRLFRLLYVLLLGAATCSGFQQWFGETPGWADIVSNGTWLLFLASGWKTWRAGPPAYTTRPGFLDTDQLYQVAGGKGGGS